MRAVNVGRRTVKMARLAAIMRELGHDDVWTHINSGNVVFEATGRRADVERAIEDALEADVGFEVTTFVRTAAELRRTLAKQPFRLDPGDTYFVTFLKEMPTAAQRTALERASTDFDTLVVAGRDVHWRMRGKSTDTKVPSKVWADVVGQHGSTSRNTTSLRVLADKIMRRGGTAGTRR